MDFAALHHIQDLFFSMLCLNSRHTDSFSCPFDYIIPGIITKTPQNVSISIDSSRETCTNRNQRRNKAESLAKTKKILT
jgi:hypothetical protein